MKRARVANTAILALSLCGTNMNDTVVPARTMAGMPAFVCRFSSCSKRGKLISPVQNGVTKAVHTPVKIAFFKKTHLRYNLCREDEFAPARGYIRGYGVPKYDAEPTIVYKEKAKDPARFYLNTIAGTYKVTANSGLNVRHGAGPAKKRMIAIPKGTAVKCYGYYTNYLGTKWLYIQFTYKGVQYTGFASSKYLKKV